MDGDLNRKLRETVGDWTPEQPSPKTIRSKCLELVSHESLEELSVDDWSTLAKLYKILEKKNPQMAQEVFNKIVEAEMEETFNAYLADI